MTSDLSTSLVDGVADRRRRRTRRALLDAAHRLFAERGYSATAVEDLARSADIALATLYGNFPGGKAEVYAVLGCRLARDHADRMRAVLVASDPGAPAGRAALEEYVQFHREEPAAFRILGLADLHGAPVDVVAAARSEITERLTRVVEAVAERTLGAARGGDGRTALLLAWASINGTLTLRDRGLVARDDADAMIAMAVEAAAERFAAIAPAPDVTRP